MEMQRRPECQKFALAISDIIKTIQSSNGPQKTEYLERVKSQFQIDHNERWIITKLRMILVKLGVDSKLLHIRKSEKKNLKMKKSLQNSKTKLVHATNFKNIQEKRKK